MIKKEYLLDIELKENYNTFCDNQESCNNCILVRKEIVNSTYDQPCEQVYDLIKMIKES